MLDELLPPPVSVVELFADPPDPYLYPAERALVARAVAKRVNEFAAVRHCARRAMAALGLPPAPVLPDERGAPTWPDGVVGSLTHCGGYRAAAVAFARDMWTIGIDAEPHEPLPEGVLDIVASAAERAHLARLGPGICWDRLLFSAKESTYKAWYPVTRSWLGFHEATVTIDPMASTFAVSLRQPVRELHGRWLVRDGLILTAVAEPARTEPAAPQPYGQMPR